jgi:carbohydrate kinase (thermoresistant glucokinase family)
MRTVDPAVVVLMGVSGCGKSTIGNGLSQVLGWPFRDADTFHPPANIDKMSRGVPLNDADRRPWLEAIAQWIDSRREAGAPGIVSCSALKRGYRQRIIGPRSGVRLVFLKGEMGLIAARLAQRKGHFMPPALLQSQFDALEEPDETERPLVVDITATPDEIVAAIVASLGDAGSRETA